jgi:hypothetical protein
MSMMVEQEKFRKEQQARISELRFEQFVRRWAPDDPREASEFHAQLYSLYIQVVHDAQEPLLKQVTAMMAAMPVIPIIKGKE